MKIKLRVWNEGAERDGEVKPGARRRAGRRDCQHSASLLPPARSMRRWEIIASPSPSRSSGIILLPGGVHLPPNPFSTPLASCFFGYLCSSLSSLLTLPVSSFSLFFFFVILFFFHLSSIELVIFYYPSLYRVGIRVSLGLR